MSSSDGSGSDSGSDSDDREESASESLSSRTKRQLVKLRKKKKLKKARISLLRDIGESDDEEDFIGHPESDQLQFAGLNIEPSSRRMTPARESTKKPSLRGKTTAAASTSSRRSKVENYDSQTILSDFVDCHIVDWLDGSEGSHCNRTRISDVGRAMLFSLLYFMTGWLPNKKKPGSNRVEVTQVPIIH